jgi:hypothetical protein
MKAEIMWTCALVGLQQYIMNRLDEAGCRLCYIAQVESDKKRVWGEGF